MMRFLAAALLSVCWLSVIRAADPQINSLTPYGMRRGTAAEWMISGLGLANSKELMFYTPGFTVTKLEAKGDDTLKATVAVTEDCQLGIHAFRLRSAGGVSNLRTFTVGILPEVAEIEPNNDLPKAQLLPLNVTVSGVVPAEDVDCFAVELKQGECLNVELEGLRLGNSVNNNFFDPFLAIIGPDGREAARSDDAALLNQDCLVSLVAAAEGRYLIHLRDVSYGGNTGAVYRLHIGNFPRPTAVFPPGGRPGEKLNVHWIGNKGGDFEQEITLPTGGKLDAAIVATGPQGMAPSPNVMRVNELPWLNELEPNNEVKTATPSSASAPIAFHGIIERPGDVDFIRFAAKKGQQLDVRVFARKPFRSPLDPLLSVHNTQGGTIGSNDDTGGPDSYLRVAVPADGDYFVSLKDQLQQGGPEFVYRVEITEAAPSLVMRLPERRQYISTTLVVPRNNHNAVMVAAQRQNFSGELKVSFEGMPSGMTFVAPPLPAGATEIPVLFSAASDAEPAGSLVGILGKPTDEKLNVTGRLDQRTMLVRGLNNVDVWGHNADRMATVLSEEIPYSLAFVQPKAPLVRNGSLDLKVVASRAEGFTAPISLRLLYNPPGVASSGSIMIPENQNEAVVPLTANNGAALGNWKIVMTGRVGSRFDRGGGGNRGADDSLRCSTEFADLTVADQYYKVSFAKAAVEQGKQTKLTVKIEKLRDFAGTAKAELVGLPANTTAQPVEFTKDTTELVFDVVAAKEAKPGRYRSVVCLTKIPFEGEVITHTHGGGEVRVDAPLGK